MQGNEQPNTTKDNKAKRVRKQGIQQKEAVPTLPNRPVMEYDTDQLDKFINTVFHKPLDHDEYILGWAAKTNKPGLPRDMDVMLPKLGKTKSAKACYFGTSTVTPHEDGKVYNRKALFKRLNVIVLDDIGTKIPEEKLPEGLIPNYIIETSEGNYQYGFILAEPIEDYALAEALIHLVYTSGYSDEGGKMPTKVVRLPAGINGKKGEKGNFKVQIISLNDDYWTPDELLDVLDCGVNWSEVVEDVNVIKQGRAAELVGTHQWSPIKATHATLGGVVDPLLEWFSDNDMIVNDSGDWVTVQCPWHDEHTEKNFESTLAGYSPLGRGGPKNANRRGFHCFHEACSQRNSRDFLDEMTQRTGMHLPMVDNAAALVAKYAFLKSEDVIVQLQGVNEPKFLKRTAFKDTYPGKVRVVDHKGKEQFIAEHALWLHSPNRLLLDEMRRDPGRPERVFTENGRNILNTYAHPGWLKGAYKDGDVEKFKNFLSYLIPGNDEREYFTQWLAAKVQNPTFRGAGILMVAPKQGTGRNTFIDLISQLFTPANISRVSFSQMCGGIGSGSYNQFLVSDMVVCDEIISEDHNKFKVYETLKDLIDPRPKPMLINAKYGKMGQIMVYASFLMLTNHIDAIGAMNGDRRIFVIQNVLKPASPAYFTELNKWMYQLDEQGRPAWAKSVWRWLQTVEVDLEKLLAPAPETHIKQEMMAATRNTADKVIYVLQEYFKAVIPIRIAYELAVDVIDRFAAHEDVPALAKTVNTILNRNSITTNIKPYFGNRQIRCKVLTNYLADQNINLAEFNEHKKDLPKSALSHLEEVRKDITSKRDSVVDELVTMMEDI